MGRKGDCRDNAVTESFFGTLKTELVHRADYTTRDQAQRDIVDYIEGALKN
jgi:transposase InsO family protein